MAHVSEEKIETVKDFVELFDKYPIIGAVNMENLPAPQLQKMRETLRGKVLLKMTKRRLIQKVLEQVGADKPGIEKLAEHLKGMPALLFTTENPFSFYKIIKQNKSPAPAKAGQEAPKDIVIPAGPTGFSPGPVIGELGALGVKSGVENGKISIKADAVVAKAGDKISPALATMLARLNINPMEVGLDVTAVYENGTIYTRSVLDIDQDRFMADLGRCASWAVNLSVEAVYPTSDTAGLLVAKAFRQGKAVALESAFPADGVVPDLIGKAYRQAEALRAEAKIE